MVNNSSRIRIIGKDFNFHFISKSRTQSQTSKTRLWTWACIKNQSYSEPFMQHQQVVPLKLLSIKISFSRESTFCNYFWKGYHINPFSKGVGVILRYVCRGWRTIYIHIYPALMARRNLVCVQPANLPQPHCSQYQKININISIFHFHPTNSTPQHPLPPTLLIND